MAAIIIISDFEVQENKVCHRCHCFPIYLPWSDEHLMRRGGGEGDDRGWDGWMASPTRWAWVWVNFRSWWWTGRPGVLRFTGSQSQTWQRLNWLTELMRLDAMILVLWMLSFKPAFSLLFFSFIKKLFSFSSLSAITVISTVYLRLLILLPTILIPACASSSPAFLMVCSAYELNDRVTTYSLDVLLSQFGISLLFPVWF